MNAMKPAIKGCALGLLFSCLYLFVSGNIGLFLVSYGITKIPLLVPTSLVCLGLCVFKRYKIALFIGGSCLWSMVVATSADLLGLSYISVVTASAELSHFVYVSVVTTILYISAPTIAYAIYYVRSHKPSPESYTNGTGATLSPSSPDTENRP